MFFLIFPSEVVSSAFTLFCSSFTLTRAVVTHIYRNSSLFATAVSAFLRNLKALCGQFTSKNDNEQALGMAYR